MPIFIKDGRQVLFIHIPKCAGSTIQNTFSEIADDMMLFSEQPPLDLPCGAQHFHAPILQQLLPGISRISSFSVVRHPLLRAISEHHYRNKLRQRRKKAPIDLRAEVSIWLREYRFDNYIHDNHIRPQIEFILPETQVSRLEDGIDEVIEFACRHLGVKTIGQGHATFEKSNRSDYSDFIITKNTIDLIQDFYRFDFLFFGYKKIRLAQNESIRFSELLPTIADNLPPNKYEYDKQLWTEYYSKKSQLDNFERLKLLQSGCRWLAKRYFALWQ